jgi:hypothetical protein
VSGAAFAWVLNLDAELELADPRYQARARLLAQLVKHGSAARELLGPLDILISPGISLDRPHIGRAWCPTPRALALLREAGAEPEPHPEAAVLRRVNHRRFAFELGGGLPGQRYCTSRAELETALGPGAWPYLLKRPLAFAGRGQLRLFAAPAPAELAWIEASFAKDGLIVEPLVVPVLEVSQHGFVWQDARYELGRPVVQDVSGRGVFKGARAAAAGELESEEEHLLYASAEHVARSLYGAGYFGPFGIDAYRYERDGFAGFCALSEINARYTLGFVRGFPRPVHELSLLPP